MGDEESQRFDPPKERFFASLRMTGKGTFLVLLVTKSVNLGLRYSKEFLAHCQYSNLCFFASCRLKTFSGAEMLDRDGRPCYVECDLDGMKQIAGGEDDARKPFF